MEASQKEAFPRCQSEAQLHWQRSFAEKSSVLEEKEKEVPWQVQSRFQEPVAAERMPRLEEKEEEALFKEMALLRF